MSRHAPKTVAPSWRSWTGMVYYGETLGFLAAWVVGIVTVWNFASDSRDTTAPIDRVAVVDASGR